MKRREPYLFEEKSFISEEETVQTQAACLNRIFRKVNSQGLSSASIQELRSDIDYVARHYNIGKDCTVLLAGILEKSGTNNLMDDEDLAHFIGCTNIEFIRYHKDLREMDKAGIIQICGGHGNRFCYRVTSETLKAVENNTEFQPVKMSGLTSDELFTRFRKLFDSYRNDAMDQDRLLEELDNVVNYNDHLTFCKKILGSPLYLACTNTERRMFFYLCHVM